MVNVLNAIPDRENLGIISISIDKKADWWTGAIKDDHLTWPQISDLKGDDSPNVINWGLNKVPMYYLLDSQWHIVERDVSFDRIAFSINDYLKRH